jgi:Notch-like protein
LDQGEDEEDDGTAAVIADLVAQGAQLNATMDKTGETSLHLAARYARADAAKRLLDAGADANAPDNTGRTPLHAAIAADAMGVFQVNYDAYAQVYIILTFESKHILKLFFPFRSF